MSSRRPSSIRTPGSQASPKIRRVSFTSKYTDPDTYLISTNKRQPRYQKSAQKDLKDNFKSLLPLLLLLGLIISGLAIWSSLTGNKVLLQEDRRVDLLLLQQTDAFNKIGAAAENVLDIQPTQFVLDLSSTHISNTRESLNHRNTQNYKNQELRNRIDEQYSSLNEEIQTAMVLIKGLNVDMKTFTSTNLNSMKTLNTVISHRITEYLSQSKSSNSSTPVQLSELARFGPDQLISWHKNVQNDLYTVIQNEKQTIKALSNVKDKLTKVSLQRAVLNKADAETKVPLLRLHKEYEEYLKSCWLGGLVCWSSQVPKPSASATRALHDFDDPEFDPENSLLAKSSTATIGTIQESKKYLEDSWAKLKEILSILKIIKKHCANKANEMDCVEVLKRNANEMEDIVRILEVQNRSLQREVTPFRREFCAKVGDEQSLAWEACMYRLIA